MPTVRDYGFRPSPLSRLGRNDELKALAPSNTSSFPRRVFLRPGFETLASRPRLKGWRSAESRRVLARHPLGLHVTRQARHLARRLASHNAGRPPPGALTVAILGSGPALPSPELLPDRSQRAPRVRVVVPGGRGPVPPGAAVTSRRRGTPRLAPSQDRL